MSSTTEHVYFEGLAPSGTLSRPRAMPPDPRPARAADDGVVVDEFLVWLLERAGMSALHYRPRSLARRLPACLRILRVSTVAQARRLLEQRPELHARAVDAVLLGVTQFFRDQPVFIGLRDLVLPELLKAGQPLRVWSAGCSEGQELYSVALLLEERGALRGCDLLGTDCRASAVTRARAGVYSREEVVDVDPRLRFGHFHALGQNFRIVDRVRDHTRWQQQDILAGPAPGPWDLVLWRNMAIYLATEAADATWRRLWRELRPGGFLITGKADHPPRDLGCERILSNIYRKVGVSS